MLLHPLGGATAEVFWSQYFQGRPFCARSLPQRALAIVSLLARSPFYGLERLAFGAAIAQQEVREGPIFIVGHWRSGTTYLHNLLSVDDRFGYLNLAQMVMPNDVLMSRYVPVVPLLLRANLPKTRGIDGMEISVESPQEEEISLGILSGLSYYNCYYFPKRFAEHYQRAIALQGLQDHERERFARAYRQLTQKLTYLHGGKPLVFKNPSSTARIGFLKSIFPKAKFVHIRRNPYEVFASSRARLPRMIQGFRWQDDRDLEYDRLTIDGYRILMEAYLAQRSQIPEDDLLETSYEELVAAPEASVERIYDGFGLPRSGEAAQRLGDYLKAQKTFCKSRHRVTEAQLEAIESEWAFAFKEWGYARPDDLVITDESDAPKPVSAEVGDEIRDGSRLVESRG